MGVNNYKTVKKVSVDEVINEAVEADYIISVPIEHYTHEQMIDMAEKAKKKDLIITVKAEYSNFYQGILLGVIKRKKLNYTFIKYI